jgi:hypothetical protein
MVVSLRSLCHNGFVGKILFNARPERKGLLISPLSYGFF